MLPAVSGFMLLLWIVPATIVAFRYEDKTKDDDKDRQWGVAAVLCVFGVFWPLILFSDMVDPNPLPACYYVIRAAEWQRAEHRAHAKPPSMVARRTAT
jgi:hypothetical protein